MKKRYLVPQGLNRKQELTFKSFRSEKRALKYAEKTNTPNTFMVNGNGVVTAHTIGQAHA